MEILSELERLRSEKNWNAIIGLLDRHMENGKMEKQVYIYAIYILHDILLEEDANDQGIELTKVQKMLERYFHDSYEKFHSDAEYLFFVGKIMHVAEWLFGQDDDALAFEMQKQAFEKCPKNLLYEWGYMFSCSNNQRAYELSELILSDRQCVDYLMK